MADQDSEKPSDENLVSSSTK